MAESLIDEKLNVTGGRERLRLAADLFPSGGDSASGEVVACVEGKYYQVGGLAADVLRCVADGNSSLDAIGSRLGQLYGLTCPNERLSEAVAQLCARGLLSSEEEGGEPRPANGRPKRTGQRYMAVRVPLLQPEMLQPLTALCARVLSPVWTARILPILLVTQIVFCALYSHALLATAHTMHGMLFVWLLIGNYLGLFVHEVGHAAACIRCGVKHGPIGFAIYLLFPVFYTDVSEAWKLPTRRRMLVDGGGMYASLWMASFAAGLYLATHSSVFGVLAMLYDLTVLMNLNPFIRMDAYWLFSDAIDVPNLMAENRSLTSWLLLRLLGIRRRSPRILSLDTKLKGVYLGYYVLFLAFTVLAGLRFLAWYPHLLASLQRSVQGVATAAHEGGLSAETLRWALRLALSLAPIVGLSAYLLGLTSRLMRRARKSLANMANSRKQECAIRDDRVSAVPNGPPTL